MLERLMPWSFMKPWDAARGDRCSELKRFGGTYLAMRPLYREGYGFQVSVACLCPVLVFIPHGMYSADKSVCLIIWVVFH